MASAPDGVDPAAWAALLKWSIAQTAEGDGTSSEPPAPMSKEKKEFLEAVMKDGVVDLVKRAGEILEALHEGTKVSRGPPFRYADDHSPPAIRHPPPANPPHSSRAAKVLRSTTTRRTGWSV